MDYHAHFTALILLTSPLLPASGADAQQSPIISLRGEESAANSVEKTSEKEEEGLPCTFMHKYTKGGRQMTGEAKKDLGFMEQENACLEECEEKFSKYARSARGLYELHAVCQFGAATLFEKHTEQRKE